MKKQCLTWLRRGVIAALLFIPLSVVAQAIRDEGILPALTPDTLGINADWKKDVWGNVPVYQITAELEKVSVLPFSPAEREAALSLVLADVSGAALNQSVEGKFLYSRLQAAVALGAFDAVINIYQQLPDRYQNGVFFNAYWDALFGAGFAEKACVLLETQQDSADSQKRRIGCLLTQGKKDEAVLAFEVYHEQPDDDVVFQNWGRAALMDMPAEAAELAARLRDVPLIQAAGIAPQGEMSWGVSKSLGRDMPRMPRTNVATIYAPEQVADVQTTVMHSAGLGVLKALALLQASPAVELPLMLAIQPVMPPTLWHALLTERAGFAHAP